jgi:hypothetical protein
MMALLDHFDPPAFLPDFAGIPGQQQAWHSFISRCFTASIASEKARVKRSDGSPGIVQFYNPADFDPGGALIEQPIVWNAFPKELLVRYGRERALIEADKVWPLARYRNDPRPGSSGFQNAVYRPLDEYCEWHVERDPHTNKITRASFSSEPPEYWEAMFGTSIDPGDGALCSFPGDPMRVLALYRELVSPLVEMQDLICQAEIRDPVGTIFAKEGQYNPYNKWNTTHGIVHLCAPPNSITAEIQLGADATVLYRNADGDPVLTPGALICCAAFGGPDRNSDPTIGATVNALARVGALITLPNPVGLYMDHIDLAGWEAPLGIDVGECVRIVRGAPGMIERLVVEVPTSSGLTVGDLTIGGEPIEYGGQIAECITVKLIGGATKLGSIQNARTACVARCCIDHANSRLLERAIPFPRPAPPGEQDAFVGEVSAGALAPSAMTTAYVRSFRRRAKEQF